METFLIIAIQVVLNTFWMFAIVWENGQRAKEARQESDPLSNYAEATQ